MPSSYTSHDRKQRARSSAHCTSTPLKKRPGRQKKEWSSISASSLCTYVCVFARVMRGCALTEEKEEKERRREGEKGRKSGSTGLACPRRVLRRQARLSYAIVMLVARILKVFSTLLFSSNLRQVNPKWKVEPSSTGIHFGIVPYNFIPFCASDLLRA